MEANRTPTHFVVEVVSPSTESRDRGAKLERYRLLGVAECWIVDPDRGSVEVWKRGAQAPEVVRDTLFWQVADRRLEIDLSDLLGS